MSLRLKRSGTDSEVFTPNKERIHLRANIVDVAQASYVKNGRETSYECADGGSSKSWKRDDG